MVGLPFWVSVICGCMIWLRPVAGWLVIVCVCLNWISENKQPYLGRKFNKKNPKNTRNFVTSHSIDIFILGVSRMSRTSHLNHYSLCSLILINFKTHFSSPLCFIPLPTTHIRQNNKHLHFNCAWRPEIDYAKNKKNICFFLASHTKKIEQNEMFLFR